MTGHRDLGGIVAACGLTRTPSSSGTGGNPWRSTLFSSLESVVLVAREPFSEHVGDGASSMPGMLDLWARCTPRRRNLANLLIQFRPTATPLADLLSWHDGGLYRPGRS